MSGKPPWDAGTTSEIIPQVIQITQKGNVKTKAASEINAGLYDCKSYLLMYQRFRTDFGKLWACFENTISSDGASILQVHC